jgi:hypothetical protein
MMTVSTLEKASQSSSLKKTQRRDERASQEQEVHIKAIGGRLLTKFGEGLGSGGTSRGGGEEIWETILESEAHSRVFEKDFKAWISF